MTFSKQVTSVTISVRAGAKKVIDNKDKLF